MFSLFSVDGKVGDSQTRSLKRPIYMLRCITRGRLIHLRMHNVTNCRTYARDLAGGALLWKKAIPTCCSIVWSPYAPFKTLLVPTPPRTLLSCYDVRIERLAHLDSLWRVGSLRHLLCQFHGQSTKSAPLEASPWFHPFRCGIEHQLQIMAGKRVSNMV